MEDISNDDQEFRINDIVTPTISDQVIACRISGISSTHVQLTTAGGSRAIYRISSIRKLEPEELI